MRTAVPTLLVAVFLGSVMARWGRAQEARPALQSTRVGQYEELPDFESKTLGNRRNITIFLPPSYATSPGKRYPVLYAQDGQNLFDVRTAFLNREWQMDETVTRMIGEGTLPEIIVVGVWNTPKRIEEYTPGPGGDRYLTFLVKELKPVIDRRFRTLRDAKHTAILGSSMGGLISTWATLRYPDVFGQSASLSSVFAFKGEAITAFLQQGKKVSARMYFDIGTQELPERPERFVANMAEMETALTKAGYRWGTDFVTYLDTGGHHDEPSWAKRVWRPLMFLFGK